MSHVTHAQAEELLGHKVYALRKDGTVVSGRLVRVNGNELSIEAWDGKARTKAILPLVLFDLLAIGTSPFGFGGFWW
jgi:hypothetical protein